MEQEEIKRAAGRDRAAAGRRGGPAQGRRPVRVRPRRRGGRGARRGRRPVRGRARASPPGVAAPAYAGIPVTHRDDASAVAFVTGHEDPEQGGVGARLAGARRASPGTLVLYMGVKHLPRIAERLIAAGRDRRRAGGRGRARHAARPAHGRRDTLGDIAARAVAEADPAPRRSLRRRPGGGAARADRLARAAAAARRRRWWSRAPARRRAGWPRRLRGLGAEVVELPAIRIEPRLDRAEVAAMRRGSHDYALVCLTSPNGAELLFEALADRGLRRPRAGRRDAWRRSAPAPRAALREHGMRAGLVPERSIAESLVEALRECRGRRAGRCWSRAPPRRATCCPTRCASAAPRSTSSRSTRPCASRSTRREREALAERRLRHLHLLLDRPLLPRERSASVAGGRAGRLDRAR